MADEVENLWTPAELAAFLGYKESTVARMASEEPQKLPPRVQTVAKPRWVPEICRQWAINSSRPLERVRVGRPRNV